MQYDLTSTSKLLDDASRERLAMIFSDQLLWPRFKAENPDLISAMSVLVGQEPSPRARLDCPPISTWTAAQLTIFDNWSKGKPSKGGKGKGSRLPKYGCALEVWTKPADRIRVYLRGDHQFKTSPVLVHRDNLVAKVGALLKAKNPLSEAYLFRIADISATLGPDDYIALMAHRNPADGTTYHEEQFLTVTITSEGVADAVAYVGDAGLRLPAFASTAANGDALAGSAAFQSRVALVDFSQTWHTGEGAYL